MLLRPATIAASALTLAEAKAHLRVDFDDDNTYISSLNLAATIWANKWLGISLGGEREWELVLDKFPDEKLNLPVTHLVSVETVDYVAADGASASYAGFRAFGVGSDDQGYILPAADETWPETDDAPEAVTVAFTAGYSDAPADLKHGLLIFVGGWYANREPVAGKPAGELPFAVSALLLPYRNWGG